MAAEVSATATNLMQQDRPLTFEKIQRGNYIFYLATLRFSNEEVFHFHMEAKVAKSDEPLILDFTKKLYIP